MSSYSFQDVVAKLTGPTGTADLAQSAAPANEGISFEMAGDKNTMSVGADGSVMNSLHADQSGRCVVRLQKTSPMNAVLQQMYDAQSISAALWGQNVIVCQQKASGDITTCRAVAFKRQPPITYAREGNTVEWEFDCGFITRVLGTY